MASPRSSGVLAAYAIAHSGAVIGYLPLLSLLLPLKVERVAGAARLDVLTACVVAGAVAASVSNVLFGWWSDRSLARGGGRRLWLALGGALTAASYAALTLADGAAAIVVAVVAFQIAINALLAPLLAMMAEEVRDDDKGLAGGLLALAAPVAAAVSAGLVAANGASEAGRMAAVAGLALLCQLPVLALRPPRDGGAIAPAPVRAILRRDLAVAWAARLLVQVAGNAVSLYLLYYFVGIVGSASPADLAPRVGTLLTLAYAAPLPIAMLLGRWSDRSGRRKPFLIAAAATAAAGLAIMARADGWAAGATGFAIYAIGSATFLALHAGFAMQLLPNPAHRGRDLGLLNLANTLPALAGPLLTWWLARPGDFGAVMAALAALTLAGGGLMLAVQGRR